MRCHVTDKFKSLYSYKSHILKVELCCLTCFVLIAVHTTVSDLVLVQDGMPRYILCYYSWYRAMADSDERMPVSAVFNKTIIIPLGLEGIVHGIP